MNISQPLKPGPFLYNRVRAGFVLTGSSLNAWCKKNGSTSEYARQVLLGERNGPGAKEHRQRLATAAGLVKPSHEVKQADELRTAEVA